MMTNEVLTFLSEGAVGIISMLILAVMGFWPDNKKDKDNGRIG